MNIYKLPCINSQADAIILANGESPSHHIPLSILQNNNYLVCCDGAINNIADTNIIPDAIVGDCDSLSEINKIRYQDIIVHIKEQETNDLTKSVHYCINQNMKDLIILGATGKRDDHTIANISLLAEYIDFTENICMITNYGVFNAISTSSIFESYSGQPISIFSISQCEVTTKGLRYPIENQLFTNWWQATLNQSEDTSFEIKTTGKLIVFRSFD